ncbi:MAG: thioredoxin family protein [Paludibacteraceae bacterium]
MKQFIFSLFVSILSLSAMGQGINFEENHDLNVALDKAKAADRLVFIDAYAVWCGPCKMMARDIFPQKEVGEYYNARFVNLKLDMEAPENIEIAKKYGVAAYPTYLFLNADGELVHKGLGGMSANKFIELGKQAYDDENNFMAISRKLKSGDMSYNTVRRYLEQNPYDTNNGELVDTYFQKLQDYEIYRMENWELFRDFVSDIDSYSFQYFLKNRGQIGRYIGIEKVYKKITDAMAETYYNDPNTEDKLKSIDPTLFVEAKNKVNLSKAYGKFRKDKEDKTSWDELTNALNTYLSNKNDPMELNNFAWMVYENYKKFDDKSALKDALGWAKMAHEAAPDKDFIADTYAHLLYENGNTKDAIAMETKALDLAKQAGDLDREEEYAKAIEKFRK